MAVSIYCRMKKIIYCDTVCSVRKESFIKCAAVRSYLAKLIGLPYPIDEKKEEFFGYEVEAYFIAGTVPKRKEAGRRWQKTLKKLKKRIQKKEMQSASRADREAFLFCTWEEGAYPAELLARYYEWQRRGIFAVRNAEQLVILDGEGMEEEYFDKMTFVSQLCGAYNYAVVITRRGEVWEALAEHCYNEYGLALGILNDDGKVHFREKKTLVLDWGKNGKKCLSDIPKGSVYMDFYHSPSKRHAIWVKCREIVYLSPYNALDTVLKDTV